MAAFFKTALRGSPFLVVALALCVTCAPATALAQGKDKGKKKEEVPAWRRALPNTVAVRQALQQYDDAEAKATELIQKARGAVMGIEQAQADVRSAVAARDETLAAAKERYTQKFELESLIEKRSLAVTISDEASKPVLEELRRSPGYLEKKKALDEAERARTAAKEANDTETEARARARVSDATQELKKFERRMLDEDPRVAEIRGAVYELDDQISSAKSKIAALINNDEAVAAAESDVSKSRAAVGDARKAAKESQAVAAVAEANVAMHLEKVQVLARRARDPLRRRDDDNNAKNNNPNNGKKKN